MAREMKDSGIEWIGKIPYDWTVIRIKYLHNNEIDSFQDGDWIESPYITNEGIRYLTTGNVGDGAFKHQGNGYITEDTFYELNCKYAYPGDLVISRLNAPYGRACILPEDEDKYVLAVDIVILRTDHEKRFICYLMQCPGYQNVVQDGAKGTTMKRISRTNLGNIALPIAPLDEQTRIADFLDRECSRIDSVIEQTRASIEEYKKLKQAIITQAVTKGIRSGRTMKDSGSASYGSIPDSWDCCKLKYLISSLNSGASVTATELIEDGYPVFGGGQQIGYFSQFNMENSLVIGRVGARCGCVTKVEGKAWATDNALIVSTDFPIDYLYYILVAAKLNNLNTSNAQPLITSGKVLNLKVPVCRDKEEQKEITTCLDKRMMKIDGLIEKKEQLLSELESYKKSLIYEYVTGKKEVQ